VSQRSSLGKRKKGKISFQDRTKQRDSERMRRRTEGSSSIASGITTTGAPAGTSSTDGRAPRRKILCMREVFVSCLRKVPLDLAALMLDTKF
jgi:hypothetical protein